MANPSEARRESHESSHASTVGKEAPPAVPAPETAPVATTPAGPPPEENQYLSDRKLIPVFVSIYIALFLVALDRTIVATAIPTITNAFNSLGDIGWYASAYLLTGSCFMLVFGRLYGFYSPKWVFLTAIFIFEIGSAICGAAPNSVAFIIGRAIAGLGSCGAFSGGIIIIMHTCPMHKRPMYTGFLGSSFGIAAAIGPVIGGAFTSSSATWRWCFYINLPVGGVALCIIYFLLPNIAVPGGGGKKTFREQLDNLDPLGTFIFLPSIICLILALQWGGSTYAWSDGRIIALLTLFAVLFVAFLIVQWYKGETATVPPRIIRMRTVAAATFYTFCVGGGMMVIVYFLPIWFQAIQGVSAIESGVRTIPLVVALVIFSIASGVAVRKIGYYVPFMYAMTVVASIGTGLLTTLTPASSEGIWIGYQVLFGAGIGMGMQQGSVGIQTVLSKKDISIGASVVFFAQQLGGAIFIPVAQNVFNQKLVSGLSSIPGFNAEAIVGSGATDLRNHVPAALLPKVLVIYNSAVMATFQVGLALICATVIGCIFAEWRSTHREKAADEKAEKEKQANETAQKEKAAEV